VIYGSASGLTAAGNQLWHQNSSGIVGASELNDFLGGGLASGDFNFDGFADLAVGASAESLGSVLFAGAVNVIYGSPSGLTAAGNQLWNQGLRGIVEEIEQSDAFGASVTSGDFNLDGFADLAIGVPGESVGTVVNAGAVNVIYGSPSGLTAAGDQLWHQNVLGIDGASGPGDDFGVEVR